MKAMIRQLSAVQEAIEERENGADFATILAGDEIKQIDRDREAEDALDETQDNEAAEGTASVPISDCVNRGVHPNDCAHFCAHAPSK